MEKFKEVTLKGITTQIEVNENGTIIKNNGNKIKQYVIKTSKNSMGYKTVSVQGKNFYVHRIVAEAYIANNKPITNKFVLHKNRDLFDNHYNNLMWGTSKDLYAKNKKIIGDAGEEYRGNSSISYEDAIKIAKRLDDGEFAKDICLEYGVSEMSIARIRKRYCKAKNSSPRYGREIKATVYKLSKKYGAAEIAKMTGLSYHTVYRWVKKNEQNDKKPVFYY